MVLLEIRDYRLTTAEILYHMPDHPGLLQAYIWQNMDLAPGYPELRRFLDFWSKNLDGKLHSFDRSALRSVAIRPGSIMPTDYDKRLTAEEFRDLMAFLTRQGSKPAPAAPEGAE